MSSVKTLAKQTIWYGVSSIIARFINYILTPYLTYTLTRADYGRMGAIYSAIPIFNILFTYGMETAFFRFVQQSEKTRAVINTATISLIISTILFSILLWNNQLFLLKLTSLEAYPVFIQLSIIIIALDALAAIPFARLRNEGRPVRFAVIRISSILINILVTIFFLSYCPAHIKTHPQSWIRFIYNAQANPVTYVLLANVIQSAVTLLLLQKWVFPSQWKIDLKIWKEMLVYAFPMLLAGLGGMVNETFDRLMLGWWLPGNNEYVDEQRGIYNACYKLAILITLFIQAFRMGAEPFFFKQASQADAPKTYARVMKWFVLIISCMFLVVSLYLPVWKYFIAPKEWEGLGVVPVLLLANMALGIYYNLSVWYKITNKTMAGAWITLIGTAITVIINRLFIPHFSYYACAWATFACYTTMMVISYVWGQKNYYIPYVTKKLIAYITIAVLLFFLHMLLSKIADGLLWHLITATILLLAYIVLIVKTEKKEFQRLPFIGRWIK